jgi:hypothetical protein
LNEFHAFCSRSLLRMLRAVVGTKDEFAATQKNGPVLGVLLTLWARTNHSGFEHFINMARPS